MAVGRVVVFSGGVGGAKLADGLAQVLPGENLTVIVNTGDDFDHLGLRICPDLDTVVYTLAGIADPENGWGRAGEQWTVLEALRELGGPDWFNLGDRDLALHLLRTDMLGKEISLTEVTSRLCKRLGVVCSVLPMTDDPVATRVLTENGDLAFQEYFVERHCEPVVRSFRFSGIENARPTPGVMDAIEKADVILFGPSNPWVSLDPILAVQGIREALGKKKVVAVSPLVGGKALKGPAAKMYRELGIEPGAGAVAAHFKDLLSGFVFDTIDMEQIEEIKALNVQTLVTDTIMKDRTSRKRLAKEILGFSGSL